MHFALVCAARGCPSLPDSAYRPARLDRQLDRTTRGALSSAEFVRVDSAEHTVILSRVFEWYRSDFLAEAGSLANYVDRYREAPVPAGYSITFEHYDRRLNEAAPPGR